MTVLALGRFVTTMKAIQTSMDAVKKSCVCDDQSAIALTDDAKAQLSSQKAELRKSESALLWDSPSTEGWWAAMGGAPLVATPEEHGPGPPGRLSALSVFHSKSVLYGAFVWARRALNS